MGVLPPRPPSTTMTFLVLLLTTALFTLTSSSDDLVSHLQSLRSQSQDGLIHLTDPLLNRILSSPTPRPFTFIIFFDAQQLHSKPELSLPALKSQFSLISSSFYANNPPSDHSKLFFFDLEFQESQNSFSLFGVNSLPHVRIIPPTATNLRQQSIPFDQSAFSRLAESMSEFIESHTKLSIGPINHPPLLSRKQMLLIVAVVLICTPFLLKKLVSGNTILHDKSIWMAGAVFVYFFSVSGTMHNIIRKMPMFLVDREDPGKLVYFYQGSGMQLGAEGFAVGALYTVVGLLLAFVTHMLVQVKNRTAQRLIMIVAMFVSFWAVKKVVYLDNWKTGYGIHAYWPSSW